MSGGEAWSVERAETVEVWKVVGWRVRGLDQFHATAEAASAVVEARAGRGEKPLPIEAESVGVTALVARPFEEQSVDEGQVIRAEAVACSCGRVLPLSEASLATTGTVNTQYAPTLHLRCACGLRHRLEMRSAALLTDDYPDDDY